MTLKSHRVRRRRDPVERDVKLYLLEFKTGAVLTERISDAVNGHRVVCDDLKPG